MTRRPTLEEARTRLRELGYLNAGVDKLLFRPVFEGRGGAFLPAILIAAAAAALSAVAAVEVAEPGFAGSIAAAGVLFIHLFVADLLPAAILGLALGWLADRSHAPGAAATGAGLCAALAVIGLWIAGTHGLARELPARSLIWGGPIAIAALLLAAAVRLAFLARAFTHSGALPGRAIRRVYVAAVAAALLVAALLFSPRHDAAAVPAPQPSPRTIPIVVLAVDGLDLDGSGKPAAIAEILSHGATGWWPEPRLSPPEIWTDLATGVSSHRHGVRTLTRVRPFGSPLTVRPPLGTSWYLRRLGPALHLVANAPVSGSDRRSLAFWEVSASAGIPSLAVGWWASAPWPGATVIDNRAILAEATDGVGVDRAAAALFAEAMKKGYGVGTAYLPGCDITRDEPPARAAAVAGIEALLRDRVERAVRGESVLIVLSADSHPSASDALGRMTVFDGAGQPRSVRIRPADAAPSILARAGVPAARDSSGAPVASLFSPGSLDTATVETYGPRIVAPGSSPAATDREYLEKLRSLGYLK